MASSFLEPNFPDFDVFVDRVREQRRLLRLLAKDCRIILICGIGGIGKSALAYRLVHEEGVPTRPLIWCSLTNAPSLDEVIRHILAQRPTFQPRPGVPLQTQLIELLTGESCHIVLDNLEVLLDSERFPSSFRPGYEEYGPFLQRIATAPHRSTVIVTSRERPTFLRHNPPAVCCITLEGLSKAPGRSLIARHRLRGDVRSRGELIEKYGGNPLAIRLAADLIADVYKGDVEAFLNSEDLLFNEIHDLFLQHFSRLTTPESVVMYRLAAARQPLTIKEIAAAIGLRLPRDSVSSILQRLLRRSLVQERNVKFFLQYLIQELTTTRLCEVLTEEIVAGNPDLLDQFPLIDARSPEHIRASQRRFVTAPLTVRLLDRLGSLDQVIAHFTAILGKAREGHPRCGEFTAANVVSLWATMTHDLSGVDLSGLVLRYLDLSGVRLSDVGARGTEFVNCRFPGVYHYVFGLAYSPEGDCAAVGQIGGTVLIVDVPTGVQRAVLTWGTEWIRAVAFSPDAAYLACADERGRVRLWNLATHVPQDLGAHERQTRGVVFSADARWLFSGGEDRKLYRWAVPHRDQGPELFARLDGEIWDLHVSPTGTMLAVAGDDGCLRVFDSETGTDLSFERAAGYGRSVRFSGSGRHLYVGCDDGVIRVWNVETRRLTGTLDGHTASIWSIDTTSTTLVSGSHDETTRIWDISDPENGRCERVLSTMDGPVWPVAAAPGGATFATVSRSSTIRFWNLPSGECLEMLSGNSGAVLAIACAPSGNVVAGGGHDQLVRIWDRETGVCVRELSGHWAGIRTLAIDPTGTLLASAGEDWDVRIWDLAEMRLRAVLHGARNWLWTVTFDPSSRWVAAGGADLVIRMWPLHGGEMISLDGHPGRVRAVAYLGGHESLVSCGEDGQVRLWDVRARTSRIVGQVDSHLTCLADAGDGVVLTGASDGRILAWDVHGGGLRHEAAQRPGGGAGGVLALAVDRDSGVVFASGHDGRIRRLRLPDLSPLPYEHEAHGVIRSLALCAGAGSGSGGGEIVAAGADETIRLFEAGTGAVRSLRVSRQFEGLDISEARGLSHAQRLTLTALGAVESSLTAPPAEPRIRLEGESLRQPTGYEGRPIEVFVSYSHRDEHLRAELDKHLSLLRYRGLISSWYDRMIRPGDEWRGQIDERLERAEIILLLISSDFLASPYCADVEMRRAMERHREGTARVIPVILRDCDWHLYPFGELVALPSDGRAIRAWPDIDAAFTDVAVWIRKTIEDRFGQTGAR